MMNDKNPLVASLLAVAKEWQKISMVKECINDFNESMSKMDIDPSPASAAGDDPASAASSEPMQTDEAIKEPDLVLEVYEDKEYDIEEVKYWNFIAKKKLPKPDIIRTLVYKVPEVVKVAKPTPAAPTTPATTTTTTTTSAPPPATQTHTSSHPPITPVSKHHVESSTRKISHHETKTATTKFSALHLTALDMAHYNHSSSKTSMASIGVDDTFDLNQFNPIGSEAFVPASLDNAKSLLMLTKDENSGLKRSVSGKKPLPDEIQPLKSLNSHQISNKKAPVPLGLNTSLPAKASVGRPPSIKHKVDVETEATRKSLPGNLTANGVVVEKRGRGRPPKNRQQAAVPLLKKAPAAASSDEESEGEFSDDDDSESEEEEDDDEEFRDVNPSKRMRVSSGSAGATRGRPPGTGRGRGRPPKEPKEAPKEVKEVKETKKVVEDVFEFNETDEGSGKGGARRTSLRSAKKDDEVMDAGKRMFFKSKERKSSVGEDVVGEKEDEKDGSATVVGVKRRSSLRLSRSDEEKASSNDSVKNVGASGGGRKYRSHLSSLSEAAKMIEEEENNNNNNSLSAKDEKDVEASGEKRVTRSKAKLLDKSVN